MGLVRQVHIEGGRDVVMAKEKGREIKRGKGKVGERGIQRRERKGEKNEGSGEGKGGEGKKERVGKEGGKLNG